MKNPEVMLATAEHDAPDSFVAQLQAGGQWWFELKYDGIRAVATRTASGAVSIVNRRGDAIGYRYPEVVAQLESLDFVGTVDGEIIVTGPDGRPAFELAHRRDAQQSTASAQRAAAAWPAQFIAFDILDTPTLADASADVQSARSLPYAARHDLLVSQYGHTGGLVAPHSQDGTLMWAFVRENDLEGLIAKRADSRYRAGRQKAWVKIKATHRVSAIVSGIKTGDARAIGALSLCLIGPDGALVNIGHVGSGLTAWDLSWMALNVRPGAAPVVVEVEYLEVTSGGQLRMPVFRGVRSDVDVASCTIATLHRRA